MEIQEHLIQISECKIDNIMHVAKVQRLGEQHIQTAKHLASKAKAEVMRAKRGVNSSKKDGIKHLSKGIGNQPAKPLTCVKRDRDTPDGGKKGEIKADPQEVDAIVKRAWKVIYDGMVGCMQTVVDLFFDTYRHVILKQRTYEVETISGEMVFLLFPGPLNLQDLLTVGTLKN